MMFVCHRKHESHQRHTSTFSTWSFETDRPLSLEALRSAASKLPGNIYRAKGVVYSSDVPERRAVLQVVDPEKPHQLVPYGHWGRVELTTLTREFFMPRFLERDEAVRREPRPPYAWDGVGEVRPFGAMEKNIVEGVY